jgi:hypothetical protein
MEAFGDRIATLCHAYFDQVIPSKGKPLAGKEWTVMSAVVKQAPVELEVVIFTVQFLMVQRHNAGKTFI